MSESDKPVERFGGFTRPHYTQVPDELFDQLLPTLSLVELRVLLYIIRRTFGFKKDEDQISVSQMVEGIVTRDGRRLDHGTGLSKGGVRKGLRGLLEREIIEAIQNTDIKGASTPTTYALRFRDEGVHTRTPSYVTDVHPQGSQALTHKKTDKQETVKFDISKEIHIVISRYVEDFAREFRDQAPPQSSITRAIRLYENSGISPQEFLDAMMEARGTTKRYTGNIRSGEGGHRSMMAYFFSVLDDLLTTPDSE